MHAEKITSRQLMFMLFIQRTTVVISFLPALTSAEALQDAWLAALVSLFSSAAFVLLIAKLTVNFPDKSIVQYSQELAGPLLGKLLPLFYLFLFLHMASSDLRIYAEVIKTGFLAETPLVVVAGIMTLAVAISVYSGLETLARCADIIFPLFLVTLVTSLAFPLSHADFQNLQPVLARGWSPVLIATVIPTMITGEYINLTMLVPSLVDPPKALRAALWSVVLSELFLVCFAVMVVSVLGAEEGTRAVFPIFKMIRTTRISEFLERMEAFVIFPWGLGVFITNAVNLYSGSKGISQLLGLEENRPFILPMAVIWVAFAIQQYRDIFEVKKYLTPEVGAPAGYFFILFPLVVLWAAYLLKKAGKLNRSKLR